MHLNGHNDLFERGIARALAQAVDGALDLRGAVLNSVKGKSGGHAQIIMRMHGDGNVLDAVNTLAQVLDARAKIPGHVISRGIGNVDDGRACLHRCLDDTDKELLIGATGVLGIELDIVHKVTGVLHGMNRTLDSLILGEMQLVAQMRGRNAQTGMDARVLGALKGLGSHLNVFIDSARQATNRASVTGNLSDLVNRFEVARARDRETGLNDVDVHAHELTRDDELLLGVHACAGRLLAIAQGSIEDCDFAGHGSSCTSKPPGDYVQHVGLCRHVQARDRKTPERSYGPQSDGQLRTRVLSRLKKSQARLP